MNINNIVGSYLTRGLVVKAKFWAFGRNDENKTKDDNGLGDSGRWILCKYLQDSLSVSGYVCMYVCMYDSEDDKFARKFVSLCMWICVSMCVCVSVRETERLCVQDRVYICVYMCVLYLVLPAD